jgi:hypothetical protein
MKDDVEPQDAASLEYPRPENTGQNLVQRDRRGQFVKGAHGNPKGKPRAESALAAARKQAYCVRLSGAERARVPGMVVPDPRLVSGTGRGLSRLVVGQCRYLIRIA